MKHRHHTQKKAAGGNIRDAEMASAKSKGDGFKRGGKKLKAGGLASGGKAHMRMDRKCRASGGAAMSTAAKTTDRKDGGPGAGHESVKAGKGEPGEEEPDRAGLASGGKLTASDRKHISAKNFALSGRRYPIEDPNHARNALARVSQHGSPEEKAKVRAAVHRKYPSIGAH